MPESRESGKGSKTDNSPNAAAAAAQEALVLGAVAQEEDALQGKPDATQQADPKQPHTQQQKGHGAGGRETKPGVMLWHSGHPLRLSGPAATALTHACSAVLDELDARQFSMLLISLPRLGLWMPEVRRWFAGGGGDTQEVVVHKRCWYTGGGGDAQEEVVIHKRRCWYTEVLVHWRCAW